jgi:hypothetical protein
MTITSDSWIRETAAKHAMINPFAEGRRQNGVISFGPSSYGHDARVTMISKYRAVTD